MKKDVCLLATLTLALTGCTEPSADAPSTRKPSVGTQRSAIVGGTPDMTHVAVFDILVEREQSCSGTLISPHLVLTAAHCIVEDVDDATELEVFTGFDESKLNEGKIHKVVAGPIHPKYDPRSGKEDGDLAVLVLAEPSAVKPMRYNKKPLQQSHIGAPAIMIGYGDTTVREPTSGGGRRLQATSPLISFDQSWVVVGKRGQTQCYGDSGGPVVMTIDGVETVVGVNSWQDGDDCDVPNFNTRVDVLSDWIDAQVKKFDPGFDPDAVDAPPAGGGSGAGDGVSPKGGSGVDVDGEDEEAGEDEDGEMEDDSPPRKSKSGKNEQKGATATSFGCQTSSAPHASSLPLFLLAALAACRRIARRGTEA